jgi:CBS domain-containing protein
MNVKHIMTWPVFSIGPDATVLQAMQRMLRHKISGLPVVDADGKLLGIVTEGDFLRRAELATDG